MLFIVVLLLEVVLVGAEGGEAVGRATLAGAVLVGAALVGVTMRLVDVLVLEMAESLQGAGREDEVCSAEKVAEKGSSPIRSTALVTEADGCD